MRRSQDCSPDRVTWSRPDLVKWRHQLPPVRNKIDSNVPRKNTRGQPVSHFFYLARVEASAEVRKLFIASFLRYIEIRLIMRRGSLIGKAVVLKTTARKRLQV